MGARTFAYVRFAHPTKPRPSMISRADPAGTTSDGNVGFAAGNTPTVFTEVLCGIDGTPTALRAVARTCELVAPEAHVAILVCTGAGAWISHNRAQQALTTAAEIARRAGVNAETLLDPAGPPVERVLERAESHRLLALGAPMVPRGTGLWIGGVALYAVHHLPSSLLIAREPPLGAGEQIVLALDGSEDAPGLIKIAAHAARRLRRGVVVVHAVGVESRSERHHLEAERRRLAEALGAAPQVVVEAKPPVDAILDVARERQASLIVMGSRRIGGVRALGSVSERVAHRARCSVLIIRPEEGRT